MTIWCRVCQKRPPKKKHGDCAGLCDPCRQAVQVQLRAGIDLVRERCDVQGIELARLLEAHRILASWRINSR